ncbi:MAG: 4Fe-4S dicluster domain-containing protein [Candidatus Freyarchaeota archaeon]
MKRILANVERCSGCRRCEMVCSFTHENVFSPSISRITVIKEDIFGFDLPIVCWHCDPCSAEETCPTEALERGGEGLILVNEEKCTGCGKCLETCAIGAIKLHPERNTPLICDQCNGKPLCVEKCPTKALIYVETEMQQPKPPNQVLKETLRRWGILA